MNRAARVTSIDAVRAFRLALLEFADSIEDALTGLDLEARRGVDWIETDRARYWPAQLHKSHDEVTAAKSNLERRKMHLGNSETPRCYEEKKAVEVARRRRTTAEQKVAAVRHWVRAIRHEADEFGGKMSNMRHHVEGELPRAVAALDRILAALEKYAQVNVPRQSPAADEENTE